MNNGPAHAGPLLLREVCVAPVYQSAERTLPRARRRSAAAASVCRYMSSFSHRHRPGIGFAFGFARVSCDANRQLLA